ncbi:MAG: hypothetical protein KAT32_00645 [Candidatus Moranbacteria bacterium]|nr:hypothetical protein [Candidatus Moranbacteria bacterium]
MNIFCVIWCWLKENYSWVIGLVIQVFIAYNIFFLQRKLSNKDKFEHREIINEKVKELLSGIRDRKYS